MPSKDKCRCAYCRDDRPFDLPKHLVEELLKGDVVVFAGAGVSTENRDNAKHTFYESVTDELGDSETTSFPALMTLYCAQPDGRLKLTKRIKERLDYFISFDDFYKPMTRFHRAIAPLYMIKDTVTTNWDDFFERECDFDAFVNDGDMALWEASDRRIMKIHGSIRNPGSIVATEQDYNKAFRRLNSGPMGAQLKTLLTNKTFIYTGYSLSDENYKRIARTIARMTRPHTRTSYFVAPDIDHDRISALPIPLIPIETDGAFFFEQLRLHVESDGDLIPEGAFDACLDLLSKVEEAHGRTADAFVQTHHPLTVFALSYQDGLIHGLQRIRKRRKSGEYHCRGHVTQRVGGYEKRASYYRRKRDYWNSSYSDGYGDAMLYLLLVIEKPNIKPLLFGRFGDIDFGSLSALLRFPKGKIKASYRAQADSIFSSLANEVNAYVPDHTPYL